MKHKVPWNRTLLEDFIKEGLLTEDEEFIMRTRLAGWSQVKQAIERSISTATVSNIVRRLKDKYNELSGQFPDRFPPMKQNDVITFNINSIGVYSIDSQDVVRNEQGEQVYPELEIPVT